MTDFVVARPHMSAVIEEMERYRDERAIAEAHVKRDQAGPSECWQAAEDCSNGFRVRDLLERHEDR